MIRLRFLRACDLTAINDYNAYVRGLSWTSRMKHFEQGDAAVVEFIAERPDTVDIKWDDGRVTLGVPRDFFEILP
jgi:hypothetical protein